MISTMTDVATPAAVMNGTPATASPRIAITTVPPAKITAWPEVATARPADSVTRKPGGQELSMPGYQEQGVIDADTQADHGGELWCPARNHDQVTDQRHRADADCQAEQRHADREAHGFQGTEGDQQDDDRGAPMPMEFGCAARRFFEGEEQLTPPASTCSPDWSRAASTALCSRSRSVASMSSSTGYCTESSAI